MILLWGVPGDGPLDTVQRHLLRYGADVRLLDQRLAADSTISLAVDGEGISGEVAWACPNGRVDIGKARAAYLRPVETRRALSAASARDEATLQRAIQADHAMTIWADLCQGLVVNPPAAMAVNNAKPFQLRRIAACGFAIPDTLVTTDPEAVQSFARQHGRVIYKSISGVRSIVSMLRPTDLTRLRDVANAPTQFQEYVPGVDVRVHVAGDEIIATEIRSSADDYRYASHNIELAPTALPEDVASRCRAMAAAMGLSLAGIDLRRTPGRKWVCFEVNPSPAFVFYEEATGQPIGDAIARLLIRADEAN